METTKGVLRGHIILGLYRDNGKRKWNYYLEVWILGTCQHLAPLKLRLVRERTWLTGG